MLYLYYLQLLGANQNTLFSSWILLRANQNAPTCIPSAFDRKGQFTSTYRHWQLAHHTLTPHPRHRQFLAYDEEPSRVLGTQDLRIYRGYDRL